MNSKLTVNVTLLKFLCISNCCLKSSVFGKTALLIMLIRNLLTHFWRSQALGWIYMELSQDHIARLLNASRSRFGISFSRNCSFKETCLRKTYRINPLYCVYKWKNIFKNTGINFVDITLFYCASYIVKRKQFRAD